MRQASPRETRSCFTLNWTDSCLPSVTINQGLRVLKTSIMEMVLFPFRNDEHGGRTCNLASSQQEGGSMGKDDLWQGDFLLRFLVKQIVSWKGLLPNLLLMRLGELISWVGFPPISPVHAGLLQKPSFLEIAPSLSNAERVWLDWLLKNMRDKDEDGLAMQQLWRLERGSTVCFKTFWEHYCNFL